MSKLLFVSFLAMGSAAYAQSFMDEATPPGEYIKTTSMTCPQVHNLIRKNHVVYMATPIYVFKFVSDAKYCATPFERAWDHWIVPTSENPSNPSCDAGTVCWHRRQW